MIRQDLRRIAVRRVGALRFLLCEPFGQDRGWRPDGAEFRNPNSFGSMAKIPAKVCAFTWARPPIWPYHCFRFHVEAFL